MELFSPPVGERHARVTSELVLFGGGLSDCTGGLSSTTLRKQ